MSARPKARRGCREDVSPAQRMNVGFVDHWRHNFAQDLHGVFMEPIQALGATSGVGGTTLATGLPKRAMRRGFLVCCTCSSKARHLRSFLVMHAWARGRSPSAMSHLSRPPKLPSMRDRYGT